MTFRIKVLDKVQITIVAQNIIRQYLIVTFWLSWLIWWKLYDLVKVAAKFMEGS